MLPPCDVVHARWVTMYPSQVLLVKWDTRHDSQMVVNTPERLASVDRQLRERFGPAPEGMYVYSLMLGDIVASGMVLRSLSDDVERDVRQRDFGNNPDRIPAWLAGYAGHPTTGEHRGHGLPTGEHRGHGLPTGEHRGHGLPTGKRVRLG
jgi:hypothetical protein